MDVPWWYWIVGVTGLCAANLGFMWTVSGLLLLVLFLCGALLDLYSKTQHPLTVFQANLFSDISVKPGIRKVVEEACREKLVNKIDKRLTGSHVIDESLHDIISFVLRDYVSPWYQRISADDDFVLGVRETLQIIVINIAARMKDVAWIPYITTRLVDDAASHLRLYRLACEQTKSDLDVKKPAPQSLASFKSATLCPGGSAGHSRNSSDGGGKMATPKTHSRNSSISEKPPDLEAVFFRLESEQESSRMCHGQLCTNRDTEKCYLDDIVDAVLYLVLSPDDFQCLPARNLVREMLIGAVLLPLVDMLAEPDYINMCFIWLCSDVGLTSEAFLATLRATVNKDELLATLDIVNKEIELVRSRDSGGEGDSFIRQQLNSLLYVKKCIDSKLQGGLRKEVSSAKLLQLPLTVLLKNSLALSYFIDHLSTIGMQNYIFLHLSIESWRASVRVERQRADSPVKINKGGSENLKEAAQSICQQYLSDQGHVTVDTRVEQELLQKMARDPLSETWFDDLLILLQKKLSDKCLPDFYRSNTYVKLLSDLELLNDNEQDEESASPDSKSLADSLEEEQVSKKEPESGGGKFQLKVEIIDSGVVQDRGKTYGIYALSVTRIYENGFIERWHVYRRYSDFYDLQQKVKDAYADLGKLPFPGKKTFNNMGALTLSKRMKMLNDYLQILLHSGVAETHPRLAGFLLAFLEPAEYDKAGTLSSALESVVSPIKSSMRSVTAAVRTVPDNLLSSLQPGRRDAAPREPTENVPLRIMLLLMDEVFDLQSRNQWLRRRIVTLLRQMFGDIVNRKILDYVEELTGASRVASYLSHIKESLWPNGVRAASRAERDEAARLRTRIVAKAALLSALSDDMKHLLGSDTTRRGLLRVYNTFQHPVINRRLVYVFLEGVLELIFPPIIDINSKLSRSRDKKSLLVVDSRNKELRCPS